MDPTTITAPQIQVGDRIRCTTADQVTHELLVGRVEHPFYFIRPVESRNQCTILDFGPRDVVTLLSRAPSQTDTLEALAFSWGAKARQTDPGWPEDTAENEELEGFAAGLRHAALDLLLKIGRGKPCAECGNLTDPSWPCLSCGRAS
jgi:hypothetical protein